jgi:hypothetical protein
MDHQRNDCVVEYGGKFKSLTEYLDTALVEAVLEPPT